MTFVERFLKVVWGLQPGPGYAFLGRKLPGGDWSERRWVQQAFEFHGDVPLRGRGDGASDLYFLPAVFSEERHTSACALPSRWLWADLDHDKGFKGRIPSSLRPTLVWRTSPHNYQCLWLLDRPVERETVQALNRRLAHELAGDYSGADIQQALRIPGTLHTKGKPFPVTLLPLPRPTYRFEDLHARLRYVEIAPAASGVRTALPKRLPAVRSIQKRHGPKRVDWAMNETRQPVRRGARSDVLWHTARRLFELGMAPEEVLAMLQPTAWAKDKHRHPEALWREVCKQYALRNAPAQGRSAESRTATKTASTKRARENDPTSEGACYGA